MISILSSIVDWCHAEPIWPERFEPAVDAMGVAKKNTGQSVCILGTSFGIIGCRLLRKSIPDTTICTPPALLTSTLLTNGQSTLLNT